MKKILWKSDLWSMTLVFGAITLLCSAYLTMHLVKGEYGEAFTMGLICAIPATLTLIFAFTDRSQAMMVWVHPHVEEELLEKAGVFKESCLNPENSERARRALDPDHPPDIG